MESLCFAFVVFCKGSGVFRNPKCECLYHLVRTYTLTEADTFMDVCFLWESVMLTPIPHGILLAVMLNAFNMSADERPKFHIRGT